MSKRIPDAFYTIAPAIPKLRFVYWKWLPGGYAAL
jgi:hypothetical protein